MKRLLCNKSAFDEFVLKTNPSCILLNADEMEPLQYPCIMVFTEEQDLYNDWIRYSFVYETDFE